MELLELNENTYGQAYGYVVYKTKFKKEGELLEISNARDFVIVILNDVIIYKSSLHEDPINVKLEGHLRSDATNILQILVENCGRVNYGLDIDNQRKGILGSVLVDDEKLTSWEIYSLEFQPDWLRKMERWSRWKSSSTETKTTKLPALYKGNLRVQGLPRKTFISLPGWYKGVVFVNGFNIGRYWSIGPQETLYVPVQYLESGDNEILVFDLKGKPDTSAEKQYPTIVSTNKPNIGEEDSNYFLI